jgi:Protein of unknown function (DUF3592)
MRIFPEGAAELAEPLGKTFCILSAFAVVVGFASFLRQYYIWHHWPTAQGVVVESQLVRSQKDEGVTLCSAAYRVQYVVDAQPYTAEQKESSSSNDCQGWQSKVDSAKGARWTVLYEREHPNNSYINPGFNLAFLFVSAWCLGFATMFTAFGVAGWKIGNFMVRRRIELP